MENKHIIGVTGIGLVSLLIILFLFQSNKSQDQNANPLSLDFNKQQAQNASDITELKIQDVKVGSGSAQVEKGDMVTINYIGAFMDGKKFDSSYDRKQPLTLQIGEGKVIQGMEKGLLGMKVGGIRKLLIPSSLAYGASGKDPIPPNTPLFFQVEVLNIQKNVSTPQVSPAPNPTVNSMPSQAPTSNSTPTSAAQITNMPINPSTTAPTNTPTQTPP